MEDLRAATPGSLVWDDTVTGLHVRVTRDGSKMFYLYYRTRAGQQRRPKLGELGQITLTEARKRAKLILDKVAVGQDPKGEWDEKKAEMTVGELYDLCFKAHWDCDRYHLSGRAREVGNLYRSRIEPQFKNCKLSEITTARVRDWHARAYETPTQTNRALEVLCKMYQYAEDQEIRLQHSNPCALVKGHPEKKRKRFASEEEIQRIAPLLEKYTPIHPHGVAFLYLLMFTGSRPRAIERATWDQLTEFEVKGEKFGLLTFSGKSSGKTGEDEKLILPPQAMKALNRLPRIDGYTITGIKMPRRLWNKIRAEANCPDLWARDWRRTFATVGLSGGVDIGVIGELLNHHTSETTKVYAKLMDTQAMAATTLIANRLEGLLKVEIKPPALKLVRGSE